MKILYYYWGENSKEDCMECIRALGWNVTVWSEKMNNYTTDDRFISRTAEKLKEGYDCIFSFDYFPLLSAIAQEHSLPYISWVYDSPHLTLYSHTLSNPCNHVYIFDYALADRYRSEGFNTVDYMPLPCNINRLEKICKPHLNTPGHDITFVGSLYNDENNLYDQITYLPEYMRGFLDAIIASQPNLYGLDLPSQLMTDDICSEMAKYVQADLGEGFRSARNEILRNMIRKKVTVNERHDLIKALGDRFNVDLYAPVAPPRDIKVIFKGYADYRAQMPIVFASSKINLNITLRSILSGIPLRVVDILGAGGFVLTNYQAELSEYFEYGKDIIWFDSPEDMIDKADYYLSHEDERIAIAANGHETAKREFAYETLLPRLFAGIG
ncbi:MAG: DUF3880 domain-containing protein [Lachnospiraceae bacterium]|nr:DUF3880 domain-containing protein [Lachnospiraceae bacterium]